MGQVAPFNSVNQFIIIRYIPVFLLNLTVDKNIIMYYILVEKEDKMRKMCVFCGRHPVDKNKEHVIPQWLIRETGRTKLPIVDQPDKKIGFMAFTMPACTACNERYSKMESDAQSVMQKILGGMSITAPEINTLLDWFDKVRVGLWLANAYLNPQKYDFQPKISIDTRVGKLDRALVVEKIDMPASDKGLLIEGIYSPIFIYSPSVFQMLINNYSFTSASCANLVSNRLGFPVINNVTLVSGGRTRGNLCPGREKVTHPVIKDFAPSDNQIILYQPIFSQFQKSPLCQTKYVQKYSLDHNAGLGGIFYQRGANSPVTYMTPNDKIRLSPRPYPDDDKSLENIHQRMYQMQIYVNNMPIHFDTGDKLTDAKIDLLHRSKSDLMVEFVKNNYKCH